MRREGGREGRKGLKRTSNKTERRGGKSQVGGGKFLWGSAWTGSHMAVNGGSVIMEWRMCGKGREKKVRIHLS